MDFKRLARTSNVVAVLMVLVVGLPGCGGGGSMSTPTYTVGGTISGMATGNSLVLRINGGELLTASADGSFVFPTPLAGGTAYAVTISTQPASQRCTVSAGTGTVAGANVSSIVVHCPLVQVLWNFGIGADGNLPQAGLIVGSDGQFYGTTAYGGLSLGGTVFQITSSGVESVVAGFPFSGLGAGPESRLLQTSDGSFYGTTYTGGTAGTGTIFKVAPGGVVSTVWSFGTGADGGSPKAGLIQASDGNFYGTTSGGGTNSAGTVYRLTPAGVESVLWSFGAGSDGMYPEAELVQGTDGSLYGVTSAGGAHGFGTVFKVTLAGVESVLWDFSGTNGGGPNSALVQAASGDFYGTTTAGGQFNSGTSFRISPAGAHTLLWSFGSGTDGNVVNSGLVQGADGNFYGTTSVGGITATSGTIFKVTPDGSETVLWDFRFDANGGGSNAFGLVQGSDGNFYGTTSSAGTGNSGTVYKLIP